jgi:hypothetical protein
MAARRFNPSAGRNAGPILAALAPHLARPGVLLEIASGTGQHLAALAPALPHLVLVPSEPDVAFHASIRAWTEGMANVRPPRAIDATAADWGIDDIRPEPVAMLNVNMIHIAPWAACRGLMAGAGRCLRPAGVLALYGPFFGAGRPPGDGDLRFDAQLRAENPEWGIRTVEEVAAEAAANGLYLADPIEMPANNLILLFAKGGTDDVD